MCSPKRESPWLRGIWLLFIEMHFRAVKPKEVQVGLNGTLRYQK